LGKPAEVTQQAKRKRTVPGYKILGRLGAGGQASVYKAVQLSMNRPVALKVIPPEKAAAATDLSRFLREARVLARLRHENIVQAIDYGEIDGLRYLVMEYVKGDSVLDLIRREKRIEPRRAIEIVLQVCRALGHAAKHGVIHRDIKPSNIVITDENRAVLVDFGLARREQSDAMVTIAGTTVGTPHYMSPEMIRCELDIDVRSDFYGLGATFFHMVTGRVPFPSGSQAEILASHLKDPVPLPEKRPEGVPEDVFRIVTRAMEKERERRYQTSEEMVADLLAAVERIAGAESGDTSAEMLEILPESVASVASGFRDRIDRLTEERDRLAEENQSVGAHLKAARGRVEELSRRSTEEIEEVRRRRQESEELRALLEVDLRATRGRVDTLESELHRRDVERQEAAASRGSLEAERATLEARLRDLEATSARAAAEVAARRREAESEHRELKDRLDSRLAELEKALAGVSRAEDERDRQKAENERIAERLSEQKEQAKRRDAEVEGARRERDELTAELATVEESLRTARETETGARLDCGRLTGLRDSLAARLEGIESELLDARATVVRLTASRASEAEAVSREVEALRERLAESARDLARTEVQASAACREADRDRAEIDTLKDQVREEREALETRLRESAEEHRSANRETARERRDLRDRLEDAVSRADALEHAASERDQAVEKAETRARRGHDEILAELARAKEQAAALEAHLSDVRRSSAEERQEAEEEKEHLVRDRERVAAESLDASARARELEREAARLAEEISRLREDSTRVAELTVRVELLDGERDALIETLRGAEESAGRRAAEAAGEIRALRDEQERLQARIAELEAGDASEQREVATRKLEVDLRKAEEERESLGEEIRALRTQRSARQEELTNARANEARFREEVEGLREDISRDREEDRAAAAAERQKIEASRDDLRRRVATLHSEIEELRRVAGDEELEVSLEKLVSDRDRLAAELEAARRELEAGRKGVAEERVARREARERSELDRERLSARADCLEREIEEQNRAHVAERDRYEEELVRLAGEREELVERCDALKEEIERNQAAREERGRLDRVVKVREEALGRKDAELRAARKSGRDVQERLRRERDEAGAERDGLRERVRGLSAELAGSAEMLARLERVETDREDLSRRAAELERELGDRADELSRTTTRLAETEKRLAAARSAAEEDEMRDKGLPHVARDEAERVAAYSLRRVEEMKERAAGVEAEREEERERAREELARVAGELELTRRDLERETKERSEIEGRGREVLSKLAEREEEWERAKAELEVKLSQLRGELERLSGELQAISEGRARDRARAAAYLRRARGRIGELLDESRRLRRENRALLRDRDETAAVLALREEKPAAAAPDDAMKTVDLEQVVKMVEAARVGGTGSKAHDDARMVLVPKGVFIAGEDEGEEVETPKREVFLPGFWIDVHPVTNRQYARFIAATDGTAPTHWKEGRIPEGLSEHPVVNVTWNDAAAYAAWCDKRLPTLLEWQKAARGTDGRTWPWGDEAEVERCNCRETGFLRTTPVKQFRTGASLYGGTDMAGNVAEWVEGRFSALGRRTTHVSRAVSGGSFRDPLARSRCAGRHGYPDGSRSAYVGFRCVRNKG